MKKCIFILFVSLGFVLSTEAQSIQSAVESKKTFNKFIIKIGYSNVNGKQLVPLFNDQAVSLHETLYEKNSQYNFEGLYKLNRFWTAGVYWGYSNGTFISNEILDSGLDYYNFTMDRFGRSYFYGVKVELQLLPLMFKAEELRFSLYCPIQVGFVSQNITTIKTNSIKWDAPALEIGAGLGVAYYFSKHMGVFGEYQLGHFYNERNSQWKAGLVLTY